MKAPSQAARSLKRCGRGAVVMKHINMFPFVGAGAPFSPCTARGDPRASAYFHRINTGSDPRRRTPLKNHLPQSGLRPNPPPAAIPSIRWGGPDHGGLIPWIKFPSLRGSGALGERGGALLGGGAWSG